MKKIKKKTRFRTGRDAKPWGVQVGTRMHPNQIYKYLGNEPLFECAIILTVTDFRNTHYHLFTWGVVFENTLRFG